MIRLVGFSGVEKDAFVDEVVVLGRVVAEVVLEVLDVKA
jgi:hypothetical protein